MRCGAVGGDQVKKPPKVIWVCPLMHMVGTRRKKDVVEDCKDYRFCDDECGGCKGPVKYERAANA
jgi:hypothetical protein